jgi:hypothetical protein
MDEGDDHDYPWRDAPDPRNWMLWITRPQDHSDGELNAYRNHVCEWLEESDMSVYEQRQWTTGFDSYVHTHRDVDLLAVAREAEMERRRHRAPVSTVVVAGEAEESFYQESEELPAQPPLSRRRILCGELPRDGGVEEEDEDDDDVFPHDSINQNDVLLSEYDRVVEHWLGDNFSIADTLQRWFTIDVAQNCAPTESSVFQIEARFMDVFESFMLMRLQMEQRRLMTPERLKLLERVHVMMDSMIAVAKSLGVCQSARDGSMDRFLRNYTQLRLAETQFYNDKKMRPAVRLVSNTLNEIRRRGMRRLGGDLYVPIARGGVSYMRFGTIEEFLWDFHNFMARPFDNAILQNGVGPIVRTLEHIKDPRIPPYVVDRHVRGFTNGFYNVKEDAVVFYEDSAARHFDHVASHYHGEIAGRDARGAAGSLRRAWFKELPQKIREGDDYFWQFSDLYYAPATGVLCAETYIVYANGPDDDACPPYHIATPAMEQFMRTQRWGREKRAMFYIMLGRLLYDVSEIDDYQVVLLLSGESGAGKSTVVNFIQAAFYPDHDRIAVLSSNKEKKFGLQEHYNADLVVCDEMDPEAAKSWSAAEFKGQASGGWMSIARKNRGPAFLKWKAPMIISSNYSTPGWKDSTGAIARRILGFHCEHKVTRDDPYFEKRLRDEGAAMLIKANKFFHWALRVYGRKNLTRHLPPEMKEFQAHIERQLAPFVAFINDGALDINLRPDDPNVYCTKSALDAAFRAWCNDNSLHIKIDDSLFESVFRGAGITVHPRGRFVYPRTRATAGANQSRVRAIQITGIDLERHREERHDISYVMTKLGRYRAGAVETVEAVRRRYLDYAFVHNARFANGKLSVWNDDDLSEALSYCTRPVTVEVRNGTQCLVGFELNAST